MGLWNWGKGKKQPQISTIVEVDSDRVSCTGETNDHPKVWYSVPEDGYVQCGYCDIMFMRKKLTETERMDKHFNGTTYTKDGERLLSNSVVGCAVGQVFFDDCGAGAAVAAGATIIDDQTK